MRWLLGLAEGDGVGVVAQAPERVDKSSGRRGWHPTVKAACTRLVFDKSTIADALHTTMHQQVTDDSHTRTPIPGAGRNQRCRLRI